MHGQACPGSRADSRRLVFLLFIIASVGLSYCVPRCALPGNDSTIATLGSLRVEEAAEDVFGTMDFDRRRADERQRAERNCGIHAWGQVRTRAELYGDEKMLAIMNKLGGSDAVLTRQFVTAVSSGALMSALEAELGSAETLRTTQAWIMQVEKDTVASFHISIACQFMLLFHAPVSQQVFFFFISMNCPAKATASVRTMCFLHADYSMEWNEPGGMHSYLSSYSLCWGLCSCFLRHNHVPVTMASAEASHAAHAFGVRVPLRSFQNGRLFGRCTRLFAK